MLVQIFFSDGAMDQLHVARIPVKGDCLCIRTHTWEVSNVTLVATPQQLTKYHVTAYVDVSIKS